MYLKEFINKYKIQYIITWIVYYAWVIVFTTWWTSSPVTDTLMGNNSRVILHSLNLISSAIFVFIIKPIHFKKASYIGGMLVLLTSVLSMLKIGGAFHIVSIILLSISLGLLNISILIPMVYVLDNTKQLISIFAANLLVSILIYTQEINILTINNGLIFSFIMLLISILPIIFFNTADFKKQELNIIENKKLNKLMYFSIILNCTYAVLCKGIGRAFVMMVINEQSLSLYPIYYIGAIVGCFISHIINKIGKFGNYASWNVIYGLFTISMFIYTEAFSNIMYYIFSFLMGIVSTMGMINMYCSMSVIGKKYLNHLYIKLSILFIGVLGGISGTMFGNILGSLNKTKTSMTLSLISVFIIIIFLVVSPSLHQGYYYDEMIVKEREKNKFKDNIKKYNLSPREEELCVNIVNGYTLRQAAAIMGIKYFTANDYCKNIYKKFEVNSKIELINKLK